MLGFIQMTGNKKHLALRTEEVPHGFPLMLSIPCLPWTFAFTSTFLPPNTSNCITHVLALSIKLKKIPLWLWFPSRGTCRAHRSLGTVRKGFPWVESDLWFAFDKQHAVVLIWIPTIYPWDSLRGKQNLSTCRVDKDFDDFFHLSWTSRAVISFSYGFGFLPTLPMGSHLQQSLIPLWNPTDVRRICQEHMKKVHTNTGSRCSSPVLVLAFRNSTTIPSSAPCQQTQRAPFNIPAGVNPQVLTLHPWWTLHGAITGAGSIRRDESSPENARDCRIFQIAINKRPCHRKWGQIQKKYTGNPERQHVHFHPHINARNHRDSCSISNAQIPIIKTGTKLSC